MADSAPVRKKIGNKNEKVGEVVSAKMTKTIVVEVTRRVPHPIYKRIINKRSKFYAHDEEQRAKIGDTVRIIECRPMSHLKRWALGEVVRKAQRVPHLVRRQLAGSLANRGVDDVARIGAGNMRLDVAGADAHGVQKIADEAVETRGFVGDGRDQRKGPILFPDRRVRFGRAVPAGGVAQEQPGGCDAAAGGIRRFARP